MRVPVQERALKEGIRLEPLVACSRRARFRLSEERLGPAQFPHDPEHGAQFDHEAHARLGSVRE